MIEYWKDILYLLGILFAFIGGNKAKKINEKGGELDNLTKYQSMYDKFVEQYQREFKTLGDKVADLELRNAIIIEESESWKKRFNELKKLYDNLKQEFENYKKKHK